MDDTQPKKKRTRIENFTPSTVKKIITEKKKKEEDEYNVIAIMQEYIIKIMDPRQTSFDIYVSTMIDLVKKEYPKLTPDFICKLCDNAINHFRSKFWQITYHRPVCYDQFDDGKPPHWTFIY